MSSIQLQSLSLSQLKQLAVDITRVLSIYGFITDSYIIEFFTNNLWETLPVSWREALSNLSSPQLADQLMSSRKDVCYRSVWPLSLLALKVTAHTLTYPRNLHHEASNISNKKPKEFIENHCQSSLLDPLFRKHVKPKKQHEIRQLGKLVKKLSDVTNCDQVVDIGSGQGHLSRYLSFGQGLSVTAVEADKNLVTMARKFDEHLMYMLQKESGRSLKQNILQSFHSANPPKHVLAWIDPKASWEELMMKLTGSSLEEDTGHFYTSSFGFCTQKPASKQTEMGKTLPVTNNKLEKIKEFRRGETNKTTSHFIGQENSENCVFHSNITDDNIVKDDTHSCPVVNMFRCCNLSQSNKLLLTGLHACGDLSVAMLRHFVRCHCVVGITSVACCYMKLTTPEMPEPPGVLSSSHARDITHAEYGYPMSSWVAQLEGHKLSYKAREVACHAIEDYIERLRTDSSILRTHCYRAVLETVIRSVDPTMKRAGVQTIKKAHELKFKEYAMLGLRRVGLDPNTPVCEELVGNMLAQQQNVVAFFSLALLLAPLVETLILLDRMIFMHQEGFHCDLIPLFKPRFSPRNLVLVATKTNIQPGELLEEIQDTL
ncbi:RRNAD1 isoform X1 [Pelobates cultripes]|uniref:rRNAD1 isoform X1 n=1 Tax=Pelobates cultripes TaxID=61616 RepID=A0AAD1TLA4_PELCU|nr:RRNAD1 isoform X1 [Pelobates cultripes]